MSQTRLVRDSVTLPANTERDYDEVGHSFLLISNTLSTDVQIGIGGDAPHPWPVGYKYTEPTPDATFSKVRLRNTTAGPMTIVFIIALGLVDNTNAIVQGTVTVDDTANGVTTPAAVVALPTAGILIDNANAVNVGGGVVGIPVTGQPFATGESVIIANTVNYDGTHVVLASSGANQVDITYAFNAELFDAVDDSIVLATPRSIAADSTRKFLDIHNHDAAIDLYYGDANVDADVNQGIPITPGNGIILPNTGQLYFAAPVAAGFTGVTFSYADHTRT